MIRTATLDELRARGTALFAAAAQETGSPGIVQWRHLETLQELEMLLLLAVEVGGDLVGYCCAAVGPELWTGVRSTTTLSLYIDRRHRGRWFRPLLRAVANTGLARGGPLLRVQAIPNSRLEQLLTKLGFRRSFVAFERVTEGQEMQ